MPAVSNTSPVLNLAIVDRLSLLREQFREILIPTAVLEELRVAEDLPGSQNVREAIEEGWIRVVEVKDRHLVQVLERDLDKGEAEAIALSLKVKAEWALFDEKEARKIAKDLGLKVTGILGILLRAWRDGDLPSLQREMEALRKKAGFRIGTELFDELVKQSGKRRDST